MLSSSDSLKRYHLFEAVGIELEYMIVDAVSLDVRPIADQILTAAAGTLTSDFENGLIAWSNELALHVIELKTNGPIRSYAGVVSEFQKNVDQINEIAARFGARLMPTAMHPWMDPLRELRLWPHEYNPVYEAYHRIFDCRGHGWANLQSTHLNLPFANDEEFARLHTAIRTLLPIIPAITASSPAADGHLTGFADYRLEVYRKNSAKIPSITGRVIPESVLSEVEYDREIFQKTYRDIAPFDPEGILQQPFLNSRGAIARFERGAIEIRIIDVQENPSVDIAIAELIGAVLKLLVQEQLSTFEAQKQLELVPLAETFLQVIRTGERTQIGHRPLLDALGMSGDAMEGIDIWRELYTRVLANPSTSITSQSCESLRQLLKHGPLSRRIIDEIAGDSGMLHDIYAELCDCLGKGRMFGVNDP